MDEHPTGDTSFKKGCEIEEGLDGSESMLRVLDVDPENCQEVRKVETVLTKIVLFSIDLFPLCKTIRINRKNIRMLFLRLMT